jgi:nitrogen fixation/metabolism regulation signal transduction histidine kinase
VTRFLLYALIIGTALMSILLFGLTSASENTGRLNQYYAGLLIANAFVGFGLITLVGTLVVRLIKGYRNKLFGSRLMSKLVLLFALVGILPGCVIYIVSVQFVSRSIESWFDVKVESALESGLNLGHSALDYSLADLQSKARNIATQLADPSEQALSIRLSRLREQLEIHEAIVINGKGRLIASSTDATDSKSPELPTIAMLRQTNTSGYATTDGDAEPGITSMSRVIVRFPHTGANNGLQSDNLFLQLRHPVPEALANQAEAVRSAWSEYQVRSLGRGSLKMMYIFTLTLTLLLAIIGAITSAFLISSQLARPLLLLAEGTKAVAEGNLSPRPIITSTDELGSLTQSFNTMTHQLFEARKTVEKNRAELENAKAYLESVLANMSAGVMVLDQHTQLVTCNASVERILQRSLVPYEGMPLIEIEGMYPFAAAIEKAFSEQHAESAAGGEDGTRQHWQRQIEIPRMMPNEPPSTLDPSIAPAQNITLLARGSHLPVGSGYGYVIVFDDISSIIAAQRSVAWGEVARRLAHEIKNPLTPIQLSAERLQMKLTPKLNEIDGAFLNKGTTTIVNQVASMKRMVDDFSDYARTPPAILNPLNLSALIDDVLHLYLDGDGRDSIKLKLTPNLPDIMGDATQLRQVIHNLLQNAQDAVADIVLPNFKPKIEVVTELVRYTSPDMEERTAVRLSVLDNGAGFPNKILARAFEPYATSKPRGTGLGLAMVKKIIDEHGGKIDIQNRIDTNGAKISILLLKLAPD